MTYRYRIVLFAVILLLITTLACNFGLDLPFAGSDGEGLSAEEISSAGTRAAEAAATAAAVASDAGQIAATAVMQGDQLAATAVSSSSENSSESQAGEAAPTAATSLEQKLSNIQPDANGNFAITITDADLNDYIAHQGGAFQTNSLNAQDIRFAITPEYLELRGDVTEPVALPLVVQLRPTVINDLLLFELLTASAGILPVPESMLDLIETVVNSELSRALIGLPTGVRLQNATLGEGEFTIFGQQN